VLFTFSKKKSFKSFVGTYHLRTKIVLNDETLEQVSQFIYLVCSISYQFSNYVEFKLAKILQLIGTIKGNIFKKMRTENILKMYNTLVFIWVRKLNSNSLTKKKN
jgi:hypothetical protein